MLASILIIAFSLALLVYWFRYSCILLLRNQTELASSRVAADHFHIGEVQERLRSGQQLDPLHSSLQRDYQILTYLLQHAAGLELSSFEDRLLVVDYKVMHWWYQLTRIAAPERARQALAEMASVLDLLAGKIGERAGLHSEG
ncbi:conserved hypothetical protein [Candidatus Sulfopaludibacter sp. SbA6]|nr:conserved hypothetical protein [Candidatus Sulfopaludibacter sp. SbA6]